VRTPGGTAAAAPAPSAIPLHAVWYQVVKPTVVVMANGQPGMELITACETLYEATLHAGKHPGACIIQHVCIFVTPTALTPGALLRQ
jgi:hypothetical protein